MSSESHIPFYNPLDVTCPKIWPGYTLILPVCAVGNVGQLACDLIISSLLYKQECKLIGRLYSPALMAVAGPNAFHLKGPTTSSTEVYESKTHKLIIIQERTSYFKELKNIFVEELVQWIKQSQFDKVLVLSSSFAQCNPDHSKIGQYNAISTVTTSLFEPNDKWKSLNLNNISQQQAKKEYLPGSGITKPLIRSFGKSFIPASFLIDFCSEGINIQNCYEVANLVDKLYNLNTGKEAQWIEPFSWK